MREAKEGEPTEPGWHENVPDRVYHSWQHLTSQSTLKKVREIHCRAAYEELMTGSTQTRAKDKGTALHFATLQPDEFENEVVCALGIDRRSNANKDKHLIFEAKHEGKLIIPESDYEEVLLGVEALNNHVEAMSLLEMPHVKKEIAGVFEEETTRTMCKFKLDFCGFWMGRSNVIGDLKTTSCDMSDDALERDIGKWGYDIQDAFYTAGAHSLEPVDWRFKFLFINLEKRDIRVIELVPGAKEDGRIKYQRAIGQWARACKSGIFPGWPQKSTMLGLKPWDRVSEFELDEIAKEAEENG